MKKKQFCPGIRYLFCPVIYIKFSPLHFGPGLLGGAYNFWLVLKLSPSFLFWYWYIFFGPIFSDKYSDKDFIIFVIFLSEFYQILGETIC
jgi:hypothetical protein